MALRELHYRYVARDLRPFPLTQWHCGVVGSGDMEVLFERADLGGEVSFTVTTPLVGFDEIWEKVLERYVRESRVSDVNIAINDNGATPVVAVMRMRQATEDAWKEARA